jgi:hypothetical protein
MSPSIVPNETEAVSSRFGRTFLWSTVSFFSAEPFIFVYGAIWHIVTKSIPFLLRLHYILKRYFQKEKQTEQFSLETAADRRLVKKLQRAGKTCEMNSVHFWLLKNFRHFKTVYVGLLTNLYPRILDAPATQNDCRKVGQRICRYRVDVDMLLILVSAHGRQWIYIIKTVFCELETKIYSRTFWMEPILQALVRVPLATETCGQARIYGEAVGVGIRCGNWQYPRRFAISAR